MTKKLPDWIENLQKGDQLVVVFPATGSIIFAGVIENYPRNHNSIYFGSITIEYTWNNVACQDDLLYDDYSNEPDNQNNWFAYQMT